MGEVWKALDTTLGRQFLASLNHPNIAAIYGFPEADLSEAGGEKVRFLAMELVRGEDLAQILSHGPMPIRQALDAARQIAAALECGRVALVDAACFSRARHVSDGC